MIFEFASRIDVAFSQALHTKQSSKIVESFILLVTSHHVYCVYLGVPWYQIVTSFRTVANRESRNPPSGEGTGTARLLGESCADKK